MTNIQILNTAIDSSWVKLDAASFVVSYKKRINTKPLDGQVDTATTSFQIAKGDRTGVENPIYTVRCVLSIDDFSDSNTNLWRKIPSNATLALDSSGNTMTSFATMGFLLRLIYDVTGQTYIKIYFGNPSTQVNWVRNNFGDTLNTSDTPGTDDRIIPVELLSIDPVPDETSDGLHFINVNLTFVEVRT